MSLWVDLELRLAMSNTIDKNVQEQISREKEHWKKVLVRIIAVVKNLAKNKDMKYEATVIDIGNKIKIRLSGIDTYFDSNYLKKVLGYDHRRKRYYDKDTGGHLRIGTKLLVRITNIDPINDNFNVKVLGMVNDNVKKKVLKK